MSNSTPLLPSLGALLLAAPAFAQAPKAESARVGFWDGGGAVLFGALPTLIWAALAVFAIIYLSRRLIGPGSRLKVFKGFRP